MSDQSYYYLIDGKEHGPFSRAAIESLLQSGRLSRAFLRSGSDQPWQAPEELGLDTKSMPQDLSVQPVSNDPAAVVFRSQREVKRGNSTGPILIGLLVLGVAGAGVWVTVKPQSNGAAEPLHDTRTATPQKSTSDLSQFKKGYWLINGSTQIDEGKVVIRSNGAAGEYWIIHVVGGASHHGIARAILSDGERDGDNCLSSEVIMETRNEMGSFSVPLRQGICVASREIAERNEGTTFFVSRVERGALYLFSQTETVLDIKPVKRFKSLPPPEVIDVLEDRPWSPPAVSSEHEAVSPETATDTPNGTATEISQHDGAEVVVDPVEPPIEDNPVAIQNPQPSYPQSAISAGIEGETIVLIDVQPDGSVAKVDIEKSSLNRALDQAATNAAWRWTFKASKEGGTVRVPMTFTLANHASPD